MEDTAKPGTDIPALHLDNKQKGIAAKLAWIVGQMDRIPKRGRNQQQGYAFATESDIIDYVRPYMALQNLCITFDVQSFNIVEATTTQGRPTTRADVYIQAIAMDGDIIGPDPAGSLSLGRWPGMALDSGDKALTKAITSAVKYFYMKTFHLSTGEDLEDDRKEDKKPPRGKAADDVPPPDDEPAAPPAYTEAQRKADYKKLFASLKSYSLLEPDEAAKLADDEKREETLQSLYGVRSLNQLNRKQVQQLINTIGKRIDRAVLTP